MTVDTGIDSQNTVGALSEHCRTVGTVGLSDCRKTVGHCWTLSGYCRALLDSLVGSWVGQTRVEPLLQAKKVDILSVSGHNFLSFDNQHTKSPKNQCRICALNLMSKVSKLLDAILLSSKRLISHHALKEHLERFRS